MFVRISRPLHALQEKAEEEALYLADKVKENAGDLTADDGLAAQMSCFHISIKFLLSHHLSMHTEPARELQSGSVSDLRP